MRTLFSIHQYTKKLPLAENMHDIFPHTKHTSYNVLSLLLYTSKQQFNWSVENPKQAQERVLKAISGQIRNSAFAKSVLGGAKFTGLQEYRDSVPIMQYEHYRPWVERIAQGEKHVLSKDAVLSFVETSGTSAQAKLIPVTKSWSKHIQQAQSLWMLSLLRDYPQLAMGDKWNIVSSATERRSQSGLPIGANTGRMQDSLSGIFSKGFLRVPEIHKISDQDAKQYVALRIALEHNLVSWTTANPSTFLVYTKKLLEYHRFFEEDLHQGTLQYGPAELLSPEQRAWFAPYLTKSSVPMDWKPADIWPLAVLNCWKGGSAKVFVDKLPQHIGAELPVRDLGITASEGYFALPLSHDWDGGVLWNLGELLEFRDHRGNLYWGWELEQGKQYDLIMSSVNGLLRYDLQDKIEVTGFYKNTPIIRFVGKSGRYINAVGEKVSEEQLALAVGRAQKVWTHFTWIGFSGYMDVHTDNPHIEMVMELSHVVDTEAIAKELDTALQEISVEYASKRQTQRLHPLSLRLVQPQTYSQFRNWRLSQGATDAQVKDCIIATPTEWEFLQRYIL